MKPLTAKEMDIVSFMKDVGFSNRAIAHYVDIFASSISRVLILKKYAEENRRDAFHQFCNDYKIGKDMRAWAMKKFPPLRVKPRIHERRKA